MERNKTEFRQLDPIKVSMTGLDMFIKKYSLESHSPLSEKLERLKVWSEDKEIPKDEREHMKGILKSLEKIKYCNLCQKEINWDKKEGLYTINPVEAARHLSCHLKNHGTD